MKHIIWQLGAPTTLPGSRAQSGARCAPLSADTDGLCRRLTVVTSAAILGCCPWSFEEANGQFFPLLGGRIARLGSAPTTTDPIPVGRPAHQALTTTTTICQTEASTPSLLQSRTLRASQPASFEYVFMLCDIARLDLSCLRANRTVGRIYTARQCAPRQTLPRACFK